MSLLLERRFWALCGAQNLGAFADNALRNATIVVISAAAMSGYGELDFSMPYGLGHQASIIVSVMFTIPILIFSPLSGQLADSVDRDFLVRKLKFIEVALMAYAGLCFAIGNGPQLIFALFLMGTQSAFFSPVRTSLMPQYYRIEELPMANGVFNAWLFIAIVAGLTIGGGIVLGEGGRWQISLILVIAAALGAICATKCPPAPIKKPKPIDWNIPLVGLRLFKLAADAKGVLYPMLGIGWFWMISAASLALLQPLVKFSFQAGELAMVQCISVSSIGAGLGSLVAGIIVGRFRDSFSFAGVAVGGNAIAWLLAWLVLRNYQIPEAGFFSFSNLPLILVLTLSAFTNGMFVVPLMAAVQARAPDEIRAKIMGASNMTNGGLATFGALGILLPMGLGLEPHDVFLVFAALQLALVIFMWRRRGAIRAEANPLTEDVLTPAFSDDPSAPPVKPD